MKNRRVLCQHLLCVPLVDILNDGVRGDEARNVRRQVFDKASAFDMTDGCLPGVIQLGSDEST